MLISLYNHSLFKTPLLHCLGGAGMIPSTSPAQYYYGPYIRVVISGIHISSHEWKFVDQTLFDAI